MSSMPVRYFYDPFKETSLNQQQLFIETLFHDYKFGFVTRLKFQDGKTIKYSTKEYKLLESYEKNCNTYISLNTFSRPDKNSKNLHSINCLYFDLDCHGKSQIFIDECINNTYKVLNNAIKSGQFPQPTMITESGRGLGLFFVLKKSIANTENTRKSINFWKIIYKCLFQKLTDMLSDKKNVLETDSTSIGDVSRIVRMPMTTNTNNNRECRLAYLAKDNIGMPVYYDLRELNEYVKDIKIYKNKPIVKKKAVKPVSKIISFNAYKYPFLSSLMEKLERLQERYNNTCTNKRRELMCFYYYNAAKQIRSDASNSLYLFNEGFLEPLPESELKHVMKSVDLNKPQYGNYEGFYKIKTETIITKLNLTEEEKEVCGFIGGLKAKKREEAKKKTQTLKAKRDAKVVNMIIDHPELTYEDIAIEFNVSVRTIKSIAAKNNISRYSKDGQKKVLSQKCKKMPVSLYRGVLNEFEDVSIDLDRHIDISSKGDSSGSSAIIDFELYKEERDGQLLFKEIELCEFWWERGNSS